MNHLLAPEKKKTTTKKQTIPVSHRLLGLALWTSALLLNFIITATVVIERYSCFNTVFEASCGENEMLVFDSVRFGRNDSVIADRCDVPFSFNCDVDVQFQVNRACAGRRHCAFEVGVDLFSDPCGYEEFLRINYLCVAASSVQSGCSGHQSPVLYDRGYVSSPNYPDKYYMDATCRWTLAVRKWQTIRVTLFDFELDVKRGGACDDFLLIAASGSGSGSSKECFKECGVLGKQAIDVQSSGAKVEFRVGETSLTQRGFFLYYEAVGPGCPELPDLVHGRIRYRVEEDGALTANASCDDGFRLSDGHSSSSSSSSSSFALIRCLGFVWTGGVPECELSPSTTTTTTTVPLSGLLPRNQSDAVRPSTDRTRSAASLSIHYGIALTLVSSLLVLILVSLLTAFCYKRRRSHQKLDKWRVVINNLQKENSTGQLQPKPSAVGGHLANDGETTDRRRLSGKPQNSFMTDDGHRPLGMTTVPLTFSPDEWQDRKPLAPPQHSYNDDDDGLCSFSCAVDRQVDRNRLTITPFLWGSDPICSLCFQPIYESNLKATTQVTCFAAARQQSSATSSCYNDEGNTPESGPATTFGILDCDEGGPMGWPLLRAVSKSAPDHVGYFCFCSRPFLFHSNFVETNRRDEESHDDLFRCCCDAGHSPHHLPVYGRRLSCRGRRRRILKRCSTFASLQRALNPRPQSDRRPAPQPQCTCAGEPLAPNATGINH